MLPNQHKYLARLTSFVVAALVCLGGTSSVAQADPVQPQSTTPTVVILDASGSMLNNDAPGLRIDAAKSAVRSLIGGLPDTAKVGLVVYGTGTGSNDDEKAAGCQDVKTLVPVGPIDDSSFLNTVEGITASGYTPIGNALRHAANELPNEGPRSIVLVSDGIDTCAPPPPCEVAKEIASDGLDLSVHTVGFKVDAAARADLECIAEVTGGTYSDADSGADLTEALRIQVDHAIGSYEAEGTPVSGTPAIVAETPLLTAGQYVDTFETGGEGNTGQGTRKYYAVEVPEGWTAYAAATMIMPPGTKEDGGVALNIYVQFTDENGRLCSGTGYRHMNTYEAIAAPATAVMDSGSCDGERVYLSIHRFGNRFRNTPATAEILLHLEPPADASGLPVPQIGDPAEAPLHSSTTTPIEGGLSFNRAAELVPGQTFESAVVAGEFRFFKVPVEWGQHLSYRVDLADRDDVTSREWTYIRGKWYNPLRADLTELNLLALDVGRQDGTAGTFSAGSTEPVRYGSKDYGFAGYYYFVIGPNETDEDAPFQYRFTLTVATPGEIEPGPMYDLSAVEPADQPESATTNDPQPQPGENAISPTVIAVASGVLALVVGSAVAVVVARRRRAG